MDVEPVRIHQDKHRNVGNRGDVDELLETVVYEPFVDERVENPLRHIEPKVNHCADGHFQENVIVHNIVGIVIHRAKIEIVLQLSPVQVSVKLGRREVF